MTADPDQSARISPPVAGHLEAVYVKESDTVTRGQAIALLRVPDLGKIRAAYAATKAKAATARTNAERLKTLSDERLAGSQSYLDAKAEADALEAEAAALGAQLVAMGVSGGTNFLLTLRSPIAGTIVARDGVVGQPVTTEQVIASVADLTRPLFLGRVFEKDLGRLAAGAPAEVTLNAFPDTPFDGTLEYLGQQIDPVARTLTARIRLTNKDHMLRVGLFGVARVGTAQCEKSAPVLVVPRTAVTEIAGKKAVFVAEPDGDYELHYVTLGQSALGKVEVAHGLRERELVVIHGVFTLKSVALKASLADDDEK